MRVLVVEDYLPLQRILVRGLREAGYAVDSVSDGAAGLDCARSTSYDVIILDIMLPKLDGLTLLRRLREGSDKSRVLILTARGRLEDRVRGLDLGADDYLVKPFAFDELKARIRALHRRRYNRASPTIVAGDLVLDTAARVVRVKGKVVELTAREYSILEVLAMRKGHVVTRDEIWSRIYDFRAERNSNVVDVYIGYLRRKLERADAGHYIHTRRGVGYVFDGER